VGLYKGAGTQFGTLAPDSLATNGTFFLVARYTFNPGGSTDDTCDLWLNPDPLSLGSATAPTPTLAGIGSGGADMPDIDQFFVRNTSSGEVFSMDELRVGTTWASVTPAPEPTIGALALAAASGLIFGRQWRNGGSSSRSRQRNTRN
jgi:hypothetical protein